MNYSSIKFNDIANGDGVRTSLFVSGCRHHCRGCFNKVAWDFNAGEPFTAAVQERILRSVEPEWISGLSILGGEPFEPENQIGLLPFLRKYRSRCPGKSLWMWTGFIYERDLLAQDGRARCEATDEILWLADVLVDGPFIEEMKDITLRFRGSSNQRIIKLR
ncbi:MAG: anaerobic ribonucleoside-triphosphate reductase activating protein [Kiritimatiellae bacterium]|nr:anaerobic ribonucleoside-triphosphate reductase activating protein [Kiritimatiellia bacterium]